MHPSKFLSLRGLTDNLNDKRLRQVIHPQAWSPVHLRALKITLVEGVTGTRFTDGAPDAILEKLELLELIEGILGVEKPYGPVNNGRTAIIEIIVALGSRLEISGANGHAEKFVWVVVKYLTDHVLLNSRECTIMNYDRYDAKVNLWLKFKNLRRFFNPNIVIYPNNRTSILTFVTPSLLHGNPNCQVVGYLLAIALKGFRIHRERTKERPYLVRLDNDSCAYFARTLVTRKYLDTLQNGTIAEDEEGFEVEISKVYDLKDTYQRAAFVASLTCVYAKILKYEKLLRHSHN
ncbi:hypothetical protein L873DRAFT_1808113 [Choiromyces venosus 120613-1]|uniref:Uncharacterized protein n=1 Tax=Choiromyces venosus 120613-1 TaxID=1336337 RepID=A0A3N4JXR3_9PEZI|nr:hypothetical protein L873DRAFT_1808113 [Choiromyces venosus 120613-1]